MREQRPENRDERGEVSEEGLEVGDERGERREKMGGKRPLVIMGTVVFGCSLWLWTNVVHREVIFHITEHEPVGVVAHALKTQGLIPSERLFLIWTHITGNDTKVQPGDYRFLPGQNFIIIAKHISRGNFDIPLTKVTVPEGSTNAGIGTIVRGAISSFDEAAFIEEASTSQGYLFPDTYFLSPYITPADLVHTMKENFYRAAPRLSDTRAVVILASLVEKEAKTTADRYTVAGILIKRLANNTPLEVDVAPETYRQKGLPWAPICNPGRESISAAMSPRLSGYWYYLSDKYGTIHYAKTFQEHEINIKRYLM